MILSQDIFTVPPREILDTRPVLTMVGGRVVFDAGRASKGDRRRPHGDLTVILRTPSPIEADVIKGLLETHGITALVTSDLSRTAFPFALNELRCRVNEEDAERARQIIESHRDEVGPAESCRSAPSSSRSSGSSAIASAIAACSSTR